MSSPRQNLPSSVLYQPFNNNMNVRDTVTLSQKPTEKNSPTERNEAPLQMAVHPVEYIRSKNEKTMFNPTPNTSQYYTPLDTGIDGNVITNIPPEFPVAQVGSSQSRKEAEENYLTPNKGKYP